MSSDFAGGYSAASSTHCFNPQREARAQEPGAVRVQLYRHYPAPDFWKRHVELAAGPPNRASHTRRAHGSPTRVRKGNRT